MVMATLVLFRPVADKRLVRSEHDPRLTTEPEVLPTRSAPQLLKALTAHTPVGVFISDNDGSCIYVNERWSELTGLAFAEALGDGWSVALHPDDRERVAEEWEAALAEERDSIIEYRFLRPDGFVTWVKGYASAVYGTEGLLGWVGSCIDLTDHRTAMQELATERETFRAAFDDAPFGMALVSPTGHFLRVNSSLCQIVGYKAEDLVQLGFQEITHPDDLDNDVELVQQLLNGQLASYQLEKRYLRPDQQPRWVAISVSLIRTNDGQPLHFVVHVEDIQQRKLAERKLRRQADHDSLTGLLNRRCLLEGLALRIEQISDGGPPAELILLDLDHFKTINDSFGHAAGDAVLVATARALEHRLRKTDLVGRLGGDEFVVIAQTDGEPADGEQMATDLLTAVHRSQPADTPPGISISATAGIVTITSNSTATALLAIADQALYQAKQAGRNRAERVN